jgi:hypothetical protein
MLATGSMLLQRRFMTNQEGYIQIIMVASRQDLNAEVTFAKGTESFLNTS